MRNIVVGFDTWLNLLWHWNQHSLLFQVSGKPFTLETLDRKTVPFDEEIRESGVWLRCVPALDRCQHWSWRVRDGKLELREWDCFIRPRGVFRCLWRLWLLREWQNVYVTFWRFMQSVIVVKIHCQISYHLDQKTFCFNLGLKKILKMWQQSHWRQIPWDFNFKKIVFYGYFRIAGLLPSLFHSFLHHHDPPDKPSEFIMEFV